MVLPQFEYLVPKTTGETCNLLLELENPAEVMAGAADLIPPMKDKVVSPEHLIDLKKILDLDYLGYDEREGLKIGVLTTLRTIEISFLMKEKNSAVAHAAKVVASTRIRAKGTVAGNVCNASPSCDTTLSPLVQGAKILIQGPNKDHIIQAGNFFLGAERTSLEPGEIVIGTAVPSLAEDEKAVCIKHAVRRAMDLATIGVAVKIKVEGGIYTDAHIILSTVTATPIRASKAEKTPIGKALTDEAIIKASEETVGSCHPTSGTHVSVEYRKNMIRVFTERAVRWTVEYP